MHGSEAIGLTRIAATTVSTVVTAAIIVSGIAKRTVRASESTSAVVRETRSPVPARSTVESGNARTRLMKSSRSRANTCSERTKDARRANHVSTVCASTNPASSATTRSMWDVVVPSSTAWTSSPSRRGPASPATAASPCSPSTTMSGRRCCRKSAAACARTSGPSAIGRRSLTRLPPW